MTMWVGVVWGMCMLHVVHVHGNMHMVHVHGNMHIQPSIGPYICTHRAPLEGTEQHLAALAHTLVLDRHITLLRHVTLTALEAKQGALLILVCTCSLCMTNTVCVDHVCGLLITCVDR